MDNFFKDLNVIELAGVLAGPGVGYFFAELGARVIKIENPASGGDITRSWKLKNEPPDDQTSAYFWSVNAFKETLWLDITQPDQLQQLYELVKEADVVITNFKAGDDKKLKVDYETLAHLNSSLIYASISGFGNNSGRMAYDLVLQAESSFMSMNGDAGGPPLKMPVALIDILAGHQLKEAILLAMLQKNKTGKGAHVSVSLFESAVASLANQATNWLIAGHLPKASGTLHPNIAPYGELFETRDKHLVTFAIGSNKQFKQLCDLLQYNTLAIDSKYSTNQSRVNNRTQLYAILYPYINKFDFKVLDTACIERGIPMGKIRNMKELFELPEALAMLKEFSSGTKKIKVVSGNAFKFKS